MNNIKQENEELRKRLEALQQNEPKKKKGNKILFRKPMTKKAFTKQNPQFKDVSSQIDYDLIMEKKKQRQEEVDQKKVELEFQDCTFQPTINHKSRKMADNQQHIFDRQLPQKKPSPPPRQEKGLEEVFDPHPKRKYNEKFYEKQLQWKKLKTEGWNKQRMNRTIEEMNSASHKPKTNKKKNQQLVKQDGNFLQRMEKQKKKLDKKLYIMKQQIENQNSFKPAINRNKKVKPQVFEHPDGLYDTIKKPLKGNQLILQMSSQGECYLCHEKGHFKRECPQNESRGNSSVRCYNCQQFGHFAKDCENERQERKYGNYNQNKVRCYNCQRFGHYAKDCRDQQRDYQNSGNKSFKCYECGQEGHYARDCQQQL